MDPLCTVPAHQRPQRMGTDGPAENTLPSTLLPPHRQPQLTHRCRRMAASTAATRSNPASQLRTRQHRSRHYRQPPHTPRMGSLEVRRTRSLHGNAGHQSADSALRRSPPGSHRTTPLVPRRRQWLLRSRLNDHLRQIRRHLRLHLRTTLGKTQNGTQTQPRKNLDGTRRSHRRKHRRKLALAQLRRNTVPALPTGPQPPRRTPLRSYHRTRRTRR